MGSSSGSGRLKNAQRTMLCMLFMACGGNVMADDNRVIDASIWNSVRGPVFDWGQDATRILLGYHQWHRDC